MVACGMELIYLLLDTWNMSKKNACIWSARPVRQGGTVQCETTGSSFLLPEGNNVLHQSQAMRGDPVSGPRAAVIVQLSFCWEVFVLFVAKNPA